MHTKTLMQKMASLDTLADIKSKLNPVLTAGQTPLTDNDKKQIKKEAKQNYAHVTKLLNGTGVDTGILFSKNGDVAGQAALIIEAFKKRPT
jgi:flagellin-like hook-associated protein FlgL